MKKYTDSKITRETLFQTFIKEKPDVLFLSVIFSTIFIISVVDTCKSTLIQKLPQKTLFQTFINESRCLVSENHIFHNMWNLCYFYM